MEEEKEEEREVEIQSERKGGFAQEGNGIAKKKDSRLKSEEALKV